MNTKIFILIYVIFIIGCSPEIAKNPVIINENIIDNYKDYELDESQILLKKINLNRITFGNIKGVF